MAKLEEAGHHMLKYFVDNGVSQDPKKGLSEVLAWQDLIGHANSDEIYDFWNGLDSLQKRTFCWVNFLTLDPDSALNILSMTVLTRWKLEYQATTEEGRKDECKQCETVTELSERIEELSGQIVEKRCQIIGNENDLRNLESDLRDKDDAYEQLRRAFIKLKLHHGEPLTQDEIGFVENLL